MLVFVKDHCTTLAAIFAGVCLLYIIVLYALNRTSLSQRVKRHGYYGCPHYKHADIIFGSDYEKDMFNAVTRGQRQAWIRNNFSQYGQTFEINRWGKRIFLTCDPSNARSMLATQFKNFGLGPSRAPSRPWLGAGIFTSDEEIWRNARRLLKPIFSKAEISDMARLDKHLRSLMAELATRNNEADLQALFLKMASKPQQYERISTGITLTVFPRLQYLDYSIDLLFGDDVNTIAGNSFKVDADAFITACDQSLLQVARSQTPWLIRWYSGWTKDWNRAFHASQDFVDRHVEDALSAATRGVKNDPPAFIDDLVQQTGSTDRLYLRSQMLNIFFPARDAAGIAISLTIFQLARHPVVWEKIRSEVLAAGLDEGVNYENLKNLQYVDAVTKETLRLHGPTGHAFRDVLVDTILPRGGGIHGDQPLFVPKGSAVVLHMHALQRDPRLWGVDAGDFRPERWLDHSTSAQRRTWEYLPFLGGPRVCPGQPMVLVQLAYIVVAFALRFREIRNCDPEERLLEEHRILMKIRNGVHVKLIV